MEVDVCNRPILFARLLGGHGTSDQHCVSTERCAGCGGLLGEHNGQHGEWIGRRLRQKPLCSLGQRVANCIAFTSERRLRLLTLKRPFGEVRRHWTGRVAGHSTWLLMPTWTESVDAPGHQFKVFHRGAIHLCPGHKSGVFHSIRRSRVCVHLESS